MIAPLHYDGRHIVSISIVDQNCRHSVLNGVTPINTEERTSLVFRLDNGKSFRLKFANNPPAGIRVKLYNKKLKSEGYLPPQVFCNSNSTTFVVCIRELFSVPNSSREFFISRVFIVNENQQKLIPFGPTYWKSTSEVNNYSGNLHDNPEASFTVSPNGRVALGYFVSNKRQELWKWDISRSKPELLQRYNKVLHNFQVPKYSFFWFDSYCLWSPLRGSALFRIGNHNKITKQNSDSPFFIDLRNKYAFFLAGKHELSRTDRLASPWLGSESDTIVVCKYTLNKTGNVVFGTVVYRGSFLVYPNMPELFIQLVSGDWYFITYTVDQNYLVNIKENRALPVILNWERVDLVSNLDAYHTTFGSSSNLVINKYRISNGKFIILQPESTYMNGGLSRQFKSLSLSVEGQASRVIYLKTNFANLGFFQSKDGDLKTFYDNFDYSRPYPCSSSQVSQFPLVPASDPDFQ